MNFISLDAGDLPYLLFYTGWSILLLVIVLLVYTGRREGHLI